MHTNQKESIAKSEILTPQTVTNTRNRDVKLGSRGVTTQTLASEIDTQSTGRRRRNSTNYSTHEDKDIQAEAFDHRELHQKVMDCELDDTHV